MYYARLCRDNLRPMQKHNTSPEKTHAEFEGTGNGKRLCDVRAEVISDVYSDWLLMA